MSNFTARAIKATFIELLEQRPLSEITVKDIVEVCGINRNSFYYHYQDLPALLEEIIQEEADAVIRKYPTVSSIVECYDALIEFASGHKTAILHIYRSVSRDVFERYLTETSRYFVSNYLRAALKGRVENPKDLEIIIDYYKCTCFGLVIDWLNHGMQEDSAREIRKIFRNEYFTWAGFATCPHFLFKMDWTSPGESTIMEAKRGGSHAQTDCKMPGICGGIQGILPGAV